MGHRLAFALALARVLVVSFEPALNRGYDGVLLLVGFNELLAGVQHLALGNSYVGRTLRILYGLLRTWYIDL